MWLVEVIDPEWVGYYCCTSDSGSYDEFRMGFELARSQLLIRNSQAPPPQGAKSKTSWWRR